MPRALRAAVLLLVLLALAASLHAGAHLASGPDPGCTFCLSPAQPWPLAPAWSGSCLHPPAGQAVCLAAERVATALRETPRGRAPPR